MTFSQRLHFFVIMFSYLVSGLVFPAFYLMPLIVYWQGYSCTQGQEWQYLVFRGAYLAATILMFRYLFFEKDALKQFKMLCGLFPVYAAAIGAALLYPPGRKPAYRINNGSPFTLSWQWWYLAPQLAMVFLHLTLPFVSLYLGWAPLKIVIFNAFFSTFVIWALSDLILAGLRTPHFSPAMDPRQVYGA